MDMVQLILSAGNNLLKIFIQWKAHKLYRLACIQKPGYLSDLKDVARQTQNTYPVESEQHAVKTLNSLIEKLERKGVTTVITDALRFNLIIHRPTDYLAVLDCLKEVQYSLYINKKTGKPDITNRFDDPTPGYKDIALKLVKGKKDPLVKELQLIQPEMFKAKKQKGHDLYQQEKVFEIQKRKALQIKDPQQRNSYLREIQEDLNEILALENELYQKAFYLDNPNSP